MFFFYGGRTWTSNVSGSRRRDVICHYCRQPFNYMVHAKASGSGHAPYWINDEGAKARAQERAHQELDIVLKSQLVLVHCPRCGAFQPDMLGLLKSTYGHNADYNANAALRVKNDFGVFLARAKRSGSVEELERIPQIWPHNNARSEINELVRQRKAMERKKRWQKSAGPTIVRWMTVVVICAALITLWNMAVERGYWD